MKKTIGKVILATTLLFGSVATNIKASDKVDFVAIGDSISTGYGLEGYRKPDPKATPPVLAYAKDSFVEFLNETYKFNTTNMAMEFCVAEDLVKGTDPTSLTQEQHTIITNADVISVTIGGNDLLGTFLGMATQALVAANVITSTDNSVVVAAIVDSKNVEIIRSVLQYMKPLFINMANDFGAKLTTIISNIKTINPKGQIIVQTIANPYNDLAANQPDLVSGIDEGVKAFNTIINQGAVTTGAYRVADVYTEFDNPGYTGLTNAADPNMLLDSHPTVAGHTLIAFTLLDAMDKKLMKVENVIEPIVDLESGAPKTVEGLKLPTIGDIEFAIKQASQTGKATVAAVNEMGIKHGAEIIWDLNNCKYDPALKTAQKFTVNGTIVLPENTSNENKLPLEVSIEVNVKAGKVEPAKPVEPIDEIKKTPDTSDTTSLIALSISALVACGAMLVLRYRKNSKAIK